MRGACLFGLIVGGRWARFVYALTIPLYPLKPTKVGDLSYLGKLAAHRRRPAYGIKK